MSKLTAFKKHEIKDMQKILGGGITYKTTSPITGWWTTDIWFMLERNNTTGDGHTDSGVGGWHP